MGSDGDYAIDNINWRIYGPKGRRRLGQGQRDAPRPREHPGERPRPQRQRRRLHGRQSGSGSGGPASSTANTVQLTNSTRTSLNTKASYKVLPHPGVGRINQEDANQWAFGERIRPHRRSPPRLCRPHRTRFYKYTGRLWFDTDDDKLYVYDGNFWEPIGGGTGGGGGISGLETVNDNWTFVQNNPQAGEWRFKDNSDAYDGGIEIEIHKESKDGTEYDIEAFKVDNTIRIYNVDSVGAPTGNGELFAHLTAVTVDSPSTYRLTYTIDDADANRSSAKLTSLSLGQSASKDLDDRYINSDGDTMDGPLVLKSPVVNDEHAATKIYVDDSIAAIPPVDLTGYATEQYVDDAIEDAVEVLDDKIDNLPPHVGQYVKKAGGDSMQGPFQCHRRPRPQCCWRRINHQSPKH